MPDIRHRCTAEPRHPHPEPQVRRKPDSSPAAEQGAILRTAVSGKTDFLIVGQQDIAVVGTDGMSTKEEKAHLLNDLGKAHIQIIDEAQFREMAGIALYRTQKKEVFYVL